MKPRSLLVLTLLVAGLGAFIFLYEKDLPSTDERAELAKKVLRLEEDAVESILIEHGGQEVRLERQQPPREADDGTGDGEEDAAAGTPSWRITAPLSARADRSAIDSLVRSLADLEWSRAFEDFDRSELGLDEPRARLTLQTAEGQSVLEIGAELPASSDMVVAVAGRAAAYQVPASVFADLTKEPGEWRDKKLFTASRGDVERILLRAGDEQVLLARRGEDFWIESPLTDRAAEGHVSTLLSELTGLTVKRFLDPTPLTPEGLGLAPAREVVEAVLAGREQPFRLEIGNPAGEGGDVVYGRADGQLFEIETGLGEALARSAVDWRSKSWTAAQVFEIESVRFEDAGGSLTVSRDGADWKRGEERVAYSAVSDLLYPITETEGEQVVDRAAAVDRGHRLEGPELSISLTTRDGEEQLDLFPEVDGLAAATADGREAVLLVSPEQVGEIRQKLEELRTAERLPETDPAEGDQEGDDDEPAG